MRITSILSDDGSDTWRVVAQDGTTIITLKNGLTKTHASMIASHIKKSLNVHLTDPTCRFCQGIGGCHNCDS
jgi:hypothetical protein